MHYCRKAVGSFMALSLGLACVGGAEASDEDQLLELVKLGNQAAVASIRTLSCEVSCKHSPGQASAVLPSRAQYWRSGEDVKVRYSIRQKTVDVLRIGPKIVSLSQPASSGGKDLALADTKPARRGRPVGECDVWTLCMMTLPGGDASVSLGDLLKRANKVKSVKSVVTDQRDLINVELSLQHGDTETELSLDFDRGANYLVRRAVANRKNMDLRSRVERKVLHFAEPTPGIFFPDSLVEEVTVNDKPEHSGTYTLTRIKINQDIPKGAFAITFPHGVDMLDWVQDRTYKVDATGRDAVSGCPIRVVGSVE